MELVPSVALGVVVLVGVLSQVVRMQRVMDKALKPYDDMPLESAGDEPDSEPAQE